MEILNTINKTKTTKTTTDEPVYFGDHNITDAGSIKDWVEDLLANMSGKKLFANTLSFGFGNNDEKIESTWKETIEINKLFILLFLAVKKSSKVGKVYINLFETNRNGTEGIMFNIAEHGTHISYNNELVEAETYAYITKGEVSYMIKETADDTEIVRTFYSDDNESGKYEEIDGNVFRTNTKINVKDKDIHNYGFVPVLLIENMPAEDGNGESDLYKQDLLINKLQKIFEEMNADLELEKTMLKINLPEGTLLTDAIKNGKVSEAVNNFSKHRALIVDNSVNGGIIDTDGDNEPISVIRGQSRLSELLKNFNSVLGMLLQSKGFSYSSQDSTNAAIVQKTEFEVNVSKDPEVGAFKFKKQIWEDVIRELIFKTFGMLKMKIDLNEITAKVNVLDIKNETALIENQMKLFEKEIITKNEFYAKVENISIDKARQHYETQRLDDEEEARKEVESILNENEQPIEEQQMELEAE